MPYAGWGSAHAAKCLIIKFKSVFNYVVELVFGLILLFLLPGIAIGAVKLFLNLKDMVSVGEITGTYLKTISDVLSLFILIELSRSLVDYFDNNRLRMTYIVDAGIVFILREIMIKLFDNKLPVDQIYALSVLLFALTVLRIGSALLYQREVAARERGAIDF
jgi:uncharacterized membrane protein (DUF373 family)